MTCRSEVSILSAENENGSLQFRPRGSAFVAIARASSSVSAGTIAICLLFSSRFSVGVSRQSRFVSGTMTGPVAVTSIGSSSDMHVKRTNWATVPA